MDSVTKLSLRKPLVFGGIREAPAQLRGEARFGTMVAGLALDAQGQPERLRRRIVGLVQAVGVKARLVQVVAFEI